MSGWERAAGSPWAWASASGEASRTGILIGSIVGIATSLIAGLLSSGFGVLVPPILGLAVGLIDGLRGSSLAGYREVSRETFIVSLLLALGLLPVLVAEGSVLFALAPLACMPWIALIAGLLSHHREGWRDPRPPRLLVLGAVATFALLLFLMVSEEIGYVLRGDRYEDGQPVPEEEERRAA